MQVFKLFCFHFVTPPPTLITPHAIARLRDTQRRKKINIVVTLNLNLLQSRYWFLENRYWWLFFLFICLICFLLCMVKGVRNVGGAISYFKPTLGQLACKIAYHRWRHLQFESWRVWNAEMRKMKLHDFFDSINCCYRNKLLFCFLNSTCTTSLRWWFPLLVLKSLYFLFACFVKMVYFNWFSPIFFGKCQFCLIACSSKYLFVCLFVLYQLIYKIGAKVPCIECGVCDLLLWVCVINSSLTENETFLDMHIVRVSLILYAR